MSSTGTTYTTSRRPTYGIRHHLRVRTERGQRQLSVPPYLQDEAGAPGPPADGGVGPNAGYENSPRRPRIGDGAPASAAEGTTTTTVGPALNINMRRGNGIRCSRGSGPNAGYENSPRRPRIGDGAPASAAEGTTTTTVGPALNINMRRGNGIRCSRGSGPNAGYENSPRRPRIGDGAPASAAVALDHHQRASAAVAPTTRPATSFATPTRSRPDPRPAAACPAIWPAPLRPASIWETTTRPATPSATPTRSRPDPRPAYISRGLRGRKSLFIRPRHSFISRGLRGRKYFFSKV